MTTSSTPVSLIGLPYLMGKRAPGTGYQMAEGPERLLADDSLPHSLREVFDDVEITMLDGLDDPTDADTGGDYRLLPRGDQMSRQLVQYSHLARAVRTARENGRFPLIAGGTCSSALGVVGGVSGGDVGMIWFDAHGDAQTPDTSANGFFEGMPVSTIAGLCWPVYRRQVPGFEEIDQERIITVGNHEVYAANGRKGGGRMDALGQVVDPPVIAEYGFEQAMTRALDALREQVPAVYVHFDADVIDPSDLRANSHAADGGLSVDQCLLAMRLIAERFEILAFNLTAWDPEVDPRGEEVLVPLMVEAARQADVSRASA